MIRLTCIDDSGNMDDIGFTIVKGQSYEPLDYDVIDGIGYYLLHEIPVVGKLSFKFWYEERMFASVHYSDAEMDQYIAELFQTENVI